jgi:hypothetical protein
MRIRRACQGCIVAAVVVFLINAGARGASAQVIFETRYPEAKELVYKTTANISQTLNLMGMEIQSSEKRTVVESLTGGKPRPDMTRPVAVRTLSLKSDHKLQGGIELSFDSTKPESFTADQNFAALGDVYRLQSEFAYTVILDKLGTPTAVEDWERTRDRAAKFDPISKEMVRGQIDPDKIKAQFEQQQDLFPHQALRRGETWERTEVLDYQGGLGLVARKKYEYLGSEKRGEKTVEKIGFRVIDVKHNSDPESKLPLKLLKSDLKVKSSEGSLLFDRELGCILESQERARIEGSVVFSGGGMEVPSELTLNVRLERKQQPPAAK